MDSDKSRDTEGAWNMVTRVVLLAILLVTVFSLLGCETAKGLKEDVQFIGDKTYEIVDK